MGVRNPKSKIQNRKSASLSLAKAVATLTAEFRQFVGEQTTRWGWVESLNREIQGNGQPGIKTRLAAVETSLEDRNATTSQRLGWLWAVIAAAAGAIVDRTWSLVWGLFPK